MNRLLNKIKFKPFYLAVLALFVFWIIVPEVTNAGVFDVIPSVADLVTGLFRAITYVFNFIGATLFTLAGMLVNLMLGLNLGVLDQSNSLVHIGWRVVRDIANLGFVLVIIVIAFATILRFEQYGVSKLLPKLIAAAIIVNFSFAIAAVFINFSHVLTNFFAARALPEKTLGSLSGWDLSTSLADAFGPQRFFIDTNPLPPNPDEESGGSDFGTAVLASITGLVFTVIFTLLGAFVLLAFAFMLLIRYLYLTFLVILAPLIWLFWVIPDLKGQFSRWWDSFLRWVFFAPASMFFVYLTLVSIQELGKTQFNSIKGSNVFTGLLQNIMIQGAQMVVLGGILIGGLIIAQQMGIKGAAGAIAMAGKARGWALDKAGAWSGRQALRAGTAIQRSGPVRNAIENLQKGQSGLYKAASYVGGRRLGNVLSTLGVVQGERLVKDAEGRQKDLSDKQLGLRVATMNNFDRVAALTRLAKSKNLDMVPNVAQYIKDANTKTIFESYGKGKDYGDLEKTFGANTAILTARNDADREKAAKEFYSGLSKKDIDKLQFNDIYAKESKFGLNQPEHEQIQKAITYGMATNNPGDVRKVLANVKSENIEHANGLLNDVAMSVYQGTSYRPGDSDLAQKIENARAKTMAKRFEGELFDFEPLGGSPPATP